MRRSYVFRHPAKRSLARILDGLGEWIFDGRCAPPAPSSAPINLLLVRLDHLGDILCLLPLIDRLAASQPAPRISVLTSRAGSVLLRNTAGIEQVIPFDAPWFSRAHDPHDSYVSLWKLRRRLRACRFDAAWDLRGDLRHIALLSAAGITYRRGYGITGGGFLLQEELPWEPGEHAIHRNLKFVTNVREPLTTPHLHWVPTADENAWLSNHLPNQRFAVIHPDAGAPAKRWSLERFSPLFQRIAEAGLKIVLVGSNPAIGQSLRSLNPSLSLSDLSGKTTLEQLVGILQRSSVCVSMDSGPAHIAAALDKPTLVIWSGTVSPDEWAPVGSVFIARHSVPCEGCQSTSCPYPHHACLEQLPEAHALERLDATLRLVGPAA